MKTGGMAATESVKKRTIIMKSKALLYAAVVAAVSLSCTREAEESGLLKSGLEMEFTAEWADEKDADSRTVLQEDGTSI